MKNGNTSKVCTRLWMSALLKMSVIGALAGIAILTIWDASGRNIFTAGLFVRAALICYGFCFCFGLITGLYRAFRFSRQVHKQEKGVSVSFQDDALHEITGTKTLYIGREWLFYWDGKNSRAYQKDHLEQVFLYGKRRQNQKNGMLALKLKGYSSPHILNYALSEPDGAAVLNHWLNETAEEPVRKSVRMYKTCPFCGASNPIDASICEYCGSQLPAEQ